MIYSVWITDIFVLPLDTRVPRHISAGSSPSAGQDADKILFIGKRSSRQLRLYEGSKKSIQTIYTNDRYLSGPSLLGMMKPCYSSRGYRISLVDYVRLT